MIYEFAYEYEPLCAELPLRTLSVACRVDIVRDERNTYGVSLRSFEVFDPRTGTNLTDAFRHLRDRITCEFDSVHSDRVLDRIRGEETL